MAARWGEQVQNARAGLLADWPLLLLVAVCLVSLPWLIHPYYDVAGDSSIYLATARSLLEGEGYRYLEAPYRVRPPGLSVILVPALAHFGRDPSALNLLIAGFGVTAVALLYVHAREGLGRPLAFMLSLSIWLNPGFQKYSAQILSDVPGLAGLIAGLLLVRRADRRPALHREVVLGAFIGLLTHLRSVSVLIVPAVIASRILAALRTPSARSRGPLPCAARFVPMALACVLVMAPWAIRDRRVAEPGMTDQLVIYDYATAQWRADPNDPDSRRLGLGEVLSRTEMRSQQIARTLGSRMSWGTLQDGADRVRPTPLEWIITLLLVLGLVYAGVFRHEVGALCALAQLAALLIYFDYHARLALPIYVIGLASFLLGARRLLDGLLGPARATGTLAVGLTLLSILDADPGRGHDRIAARHLDLEERCLALARALPPDARLATTVGWHYTMCLERPVFLIAQRVMMEGNAAAAEKVIDRYDVDLVFLDRTKAYDRRFAPYFQAVYGEPKRMGHLDVWRVRN